MNALELIAAERQRQISKGYNADHDDTHNDGSLAALAAFLAIPEGRTGEVALEPWAAEYSDHIAHKWGTDRVKLLTIAAALLVAEIERLQRITVLTA